MKVPFIFAAVLSFLTLGHFAEAREFYKADAVFKLSRTSADTGTVSMPGTLSAAFIWSDDRAYCSARVSEVAYPCKIIRTGDYGADATLVFPKELYLNVLLSLGAPTNLFETLASLSFTDQAYNIDDDMGYMDRIQLDPIDPSYSYHLAIDISRSTKR